MNDVSSQPVSLPFLIEGILSNLSQDLGFSESTVKSMRSTHFSPLEKYCLENSENMFSEDLYCQIHSWYLSQLVEGDITRQTFNKRVKGLDLILEYYRYSTISWKMRKKTKPTVVSDSWETTIDLYLSQRALCSQTLKDEERILKELSVFLTEFDVTTPNMVRFDNLTAYISYVTPSRSRSMDKVITAIKFYFSFLYDLGQIEINPSTALTMPRSPYRYVRKHAEDSTIKEVLNGISGLNKNDKRDRAVILLGATTGLRAGDIAQLKLSDLNWRESRLSFLQGKTKQRLDLPLHSGVINALADYILNERPKSESDSLFLRGLAPFQPFEDGKGIQNILDRRLEKVGIIRKPNDGLTFHGLRRRLGTKMVTEKIELGTVSSVLGHKTNISSKKYISLDIQNLRSCVLPMSSLEESI